METMTIHRALSELKLIDKKIERALSELEPAGIHQKDRLINNFFTKDDFEKTMRSRLQSATDLIARKFIIKSTIASSNTMTIVQVGKKEMTVTEAINNKYILENKKALIKELKNRLNSLKASITRNNEAVEAQAIRLAEVAMQKDNVKVTDSDVLAITGPYLDKNYFTLFDPLDIQKTIDAMTEEVNDFEMNVDAALSESNALTTIQI